MLATKWGQEHSFSMPQPAKGNERIELGRIMDDEGVWHEEHEAIENIIMDYFKSIFSSDQPSNFKASLEAMDKKVTPKMNKVLLKEFRAEEVWSALKQMYPTKSPGPNGTSPIFYQKYWDIVGPSVSNCVLH